MSAFGRMQRATALVPLAVLSAAWTASLAGGGGFGSAGDERLPDGTAVPTEAIEAPATVSVPGVVAPSVPRGQAARVVASASTSGIPAAALAAYQRAEAVINAADPSCRLPWQLIAAIGRVESDHGRFGGNVLDDGGVARPGIYGIALDGRRGTQRITDTDAGQYDSDDAYDRAVGPMQFIPSTWTVVGVDGDDDGRRDPQDIDDAALATAVYLCSGDDDLSTEQGQRASVYRYNHSHDYVDLVLSILQVYLDGDFIAAPTRTTSAGVFVPAPVRSPGTGSGPGGEDGTQATSGGGAGTATASPTRGPTTGPTKGPTKQPTEQPTATQTPTQGPTATSTETPAQGPTQQPTSDPTTGPTSTSPAPGGPQPTLPSSSVSPLGQTLTYADAQAQCVASGIDDPAALRACIRDLMTP